MKRKIWPLGGLWHKTFPDGICYLWPNSVYILTVCWSLTWKWLRTTGLALPFGAIPGADWCGLLWPFSTNLDIDGHTIPCSSTFHVVLLWSPYWVFILSVLFWTIEKLYAITSDSQPRFSLRNFNLFMLLFCKLLILTLSYSGVKGSRNTVADQQSHNASWRDTLWA